MATGIIVEYNPMHIGHIHHANAARAAGEPVIAAMSGWFVQRGEPAITDPYTRARIAVRNGVDLVLLLPVVHSIQSATYFARGGVDLLIAAGAKRIVYGSENPERAEAESAEMSERDALISGIRQGRSYASAHAYALGGAYLDANTRLGLCYREAIRRRSAGVSAVAIRRAPWEQGTTPRDEQNASSLRCKLIAGDLPAGLAESVFPPYRTLEDYFHVLTHLVLFPREDPAAFPYFEPGLDERLKKTRPGADSCEAWVLAARSKRHTMARIRRFLLHVLLGLTVSEIARHAENMPQAVVPLAMNDKGRAHLRSLKGERTILSTAKALHRYCHQNPTPLSWDLHAEKIYRLPDL